MKKRWDKTADHLLDILTVYAAAVGIIGFTILLIIIFLCVIS